MVSMVLVMMVMMHLVLVIAVDVHSIKSKMMLLNPNNECARHPAEDLISLVFSILHDGFETKPFFGHNKDEYEMVNIQTNINIDDTNSSVKFSQIDFSDQKEN